MKVCRICGCTDAQKYMHIDTVKEIIEEAYEDVDITTEKVETHSQKVCNKCYQKLKGWSKDYDKFKSFKKKNKNSDKVFSSNWALPPWSEHPVIHLVSGCPCGAQESSESDSDRAAARSSGTTDHDQDFDGGTTPSKIAKLTPVPMVSPSDKLTARQSRKHVPANLSVKFGYAQASEDEAGNVVMSEERVEKVYVSKDSFEVERLDNIEVARFYLCQICGQFPRHGQVNLQCNHFFCQTCIENFKEKIKTTKCPAVDQDENICGAFIGNLIKFAGFAKDIHAAIGISCRNPNCGERFSVNEIDVHEVSCKTRGSYQRQKVSLAQSRSKQLHKDASEALETLNEWCLKHKVSPCDFLFYSLNKSIHMEKPEMEKTVQEAFKEYLKGEKVKEEVISPMMALALKIETNLSQALLCQSFG